MRTYPFRAIWRRTVRGADKLIEEDVDVQEPLLFAPRDCDLPILT
jgi:hypothetical protein